MGVGVRRSPSADAKIVARAGVAYERPPRPGGVRARRPGRTWPVRLRASVRARVCLIASARRPRPPTQLADALGDWCAARWSEVAEHVPVELAERARVAARDAQADAIVCVGGGSAIGLAKAVALELDAPDRGGADHVRGLGDDADVRAHGRAQAHRARPTRAAACRRVRPRTHARPAGRHERGECAATRSRIASRACTGPGANPVTSLAAVEGIRVLAEAIAAARRGSRKTSACAASCCTARYLAGTVIATVGVGIHHRTCHVLGGSYGLGHAACNAVVLPHAIAYNAPEIPAIIRRVADAMVDERPGRVRVRPRRRRRVCRSSLETLGLPEVGARRRGRAGRGGDQREPARRRLRVGPRHARRRVAGHAAVGSGQSRYAAADRAHLAGLEVVERLHDLFARVHHERSVARDGLAERCAREHAAPRRARRRPRRESCRRRR